MQRRHLITVCGVPGAGKSTFASHLVRNWGAASFASEQFARELQDGGRGATGDLTKEAIAYAYSAMAAAITRALDTHPLVIAVGSFRSEDQRKHFRHIATHSGASATTVRIVCSAALAAERIQARLALGERGPGTDAIVHIDAQLNRANDIDLVLSNEASIADFHRRVDAMIQALQCSWDHDAPSAAMQR